MAREAAPALRIGRRGPRAEGARREHARRSGRGSSRCTNRRSAPSTNTVAGPDYGAAVIGYLDIETSFERDVTVVGLLRPDTRPRPTRRRCRSPRRHSRCECSTGSTPCARSTASRSTSPSCSGSSASVSLERFRSLDLTSGAAGPASAAASSGSRAELQIPRRLARGQWIRCDGPVGAMGERRPRGISRRSSRYNADDVINLALLERRLRGDLELPTPMKAARRRRNERTAAITSKYWAERGGKPQPRPRHALTPKEEHATS